MDTPASISSVISLLVGGIIGMLFLAGLLIAFVVIYQRRLAEQQARRVARERDHQRELLTAAVDVQEAERRRIAADLHDDIGSLLSATRLYLRQLAPEATADRRSQIKEQSLGIVDEMIRNTRRITHDLLPPVLEKFGFQAAVEDLCDRLNGSGMEIIFFANSEKRLAPKREIALYRVVQELLNNTIKHAKAEVVNIVANWSEEGFEMVFSDDGVGFDLEARQARGLGLRNIESRVILVGGTVVTETSPGNGLRVTIDIPFTPPEPEDLF